jgi:hypothetical protein
MELYDRAAIAAVPYLLGINSDEGTHELRRNAGRECGFGRTQYNKAS